MQIPIPRFLVRAWEVAGEWGNVVLWERGKYDLRRLDLVMGFFFLVCISWYGYLYGWLGAVEGGIFFITMVMLALFIRRPD